MVKATIIAFHPHVPPINTPFDSSSSTSTVEKAIISVASLDGLDVVGDDREVLSVGVPEGASVSLVRAAVGSIGAAVGSAEGAVMGTVGAVDGLEVVGDDVVGGLDGLDVVGLDVVGFDVVGVEVVVVVVP